MGLTYIYKKFTAQDKAIIPFNAHKQYNFQSSSAVLHNIRHDNTSYTSESISLYSSASSVYGGDSKNVIKYNQLDHLFYRDYITKAAIKKDFLSYLENRRELYKKANILSIPSGLYGAEIKKSSFYLSSSRFEVIDDSKGNLIISGTNVLDYPNNVNENVFRLDPIKGHKKYDLGVYEDYAEVYGGFYQGDFEVVTKKFYRQGSKIPGAPGTYTTPGQLGMEETTKYPLSYYPPDKDDSYFCNYLNYNNVNFLEGQVGHSQHKFSSISFNSATGSYIMVSHNENFNFNTEQDFSISFYISPQKTGSVNVPGMNFDEKRYIIAKSGTRRTVLNSGSSFVDVNASPQYPFEIFMRSQSLFFSRSDGKITNTINGEITASGTAQRTSHILCQVSSSIMEIWFDGTKIASTPSTIKKGTRNKANLYIGSKGPLNTENDDNGNINRAMYFNGKLSNINIWSRAYNSTAITNISESVNGSPYIGNIFYKSGFAAITHPNFYDILSGSEELHGGINTLQFQGSHLIYENEYQCDIQEHEFNLTTNISARKLTGTNPYELAAFTTSSHFQPYITTIGLYNENNELLVVGKLGQPIRMSDETDTTFVLRWDT